MYRGYCIVRVCSASPRCASSVSRIHGCPSSHGCPSRACSCGERWGRRAIHQTRRLWRLNGSRHGTGCFDGDHPQNPGMSTQLQHSGARRPAPTRPCRIPRQSRRCSGRRTRPTLRRRTQWARQRRSHQDRLLRIPPTQPQRPQPAKPRHHPPA